MTIYEIAARTLSNRFDDDFPWWQYSVTPNDIYRVISDATGFDRGDPFTSADQVMQYFTASEQQAMFGGDAVTDPEVLAVFAQTVIANRWNCRF